MTLPWTPETWPIAAAMIPFPGRLPDGQPVQDADPQVWADSLTDVADAGFDCVDPTDSWLRVADLDPARRADFVAICRDLGLSIPAISTSRRSVIDPDHGDEYLAYSHRVIDTAAELGAGHVSFGLFGPLTPAQQNALWLWTEQGVRNPDDAATYKQAVEHLLETNSFPSGHASSAAAYTGVPQPTP